MAQPKASNAKSWERVISYSMNNLEIQQSHLHWLRY